MNTELEPQTDTDRFNAFYQAHHAHLSAYVHTLIFCPEDAVQVCQDTWLKVWKGLPYAHPPSFMWLCQIAKYTAIDEIRKVERRGPVTSLDFEVSPGVTIGEILEDNATDFTEQVALREMIRAILARMNPYHVQALVMKVRGYRDEEIATVSGRHAKSGVLRGRRAFREKWAAKEAACSVE